MKCYPWIVALIAMVCAGNARAEEMMLSADEAVAMALRQNPVVQAYRLNTQVRLAGVAEEEFQFGRTLSFQVSHADSREPSISALEGVPTTRTNTQQVALVLSQNLTTGGRVDVTLAQNRTSNNAGFRTIDPVYDSDVSFRFIQPLLRGRGAVNRLGVEIARNEQARAGIDFEGFRRELAAEVRRGYWELALAREERNVQQQLHSGGLRVLETARARVAMGAAARNSILQAEVGVARREEAILLAEDRVRDAEDRLKTLMGLADRAALRIVPTDSPVVAPFPDDLESGLRRALAQNTGFRLSDLEVQTRTLQAGLARDAARPEINLSLRAGLSGIGAQYADDLRGLGGADGRAWQGGFSLDIPIGASANRARYQQRRLEVEQAELTRSYQRMQLEEAVRERFRQVHTNERRTGVARMAEQLAERSVKEEENRLSLGLSTVREVLDAQDDLAEARGKRLQAVVDFQRALIAWRQVTGETLE